GKIEARLAKLADQHAKNDEISIILRGPDTDKLIRRYSHKSKPLSFVGAIATTVKVKELDAIAADPDVSFVLADPPVAPHGAVDYSQLQTVYPFADRAPK